jgi:peptidoglycan/xylan/chitin deacetylase (PgdA/CDA1 family)
VPGVWLAYHEVYDGEPAVDVREGASLYHLPVDAFRAHVDAVAESGVAVRTVGDWVAGRSGDGDHLTFTFDDGWAGSLGPAVDCLAAAGMAGTFFVTRDFVGTPNYADAERIRTARDAGMEIGAHGATHRFLADCSEAEIREELTASKAFLEDLLQQPVESMSAPGGAWSPAVARIARECGYRALCTSRPGRNGPGTDPMRLRRVAVRRGTGPEAVRRYAGQAVTREVVRAAVLDVPRRLLGRRGYARLRARLLGDDGATGVTEPGG